MAYQLALSEPRAATFTEELADFVYAGQDTQVEERDGVTFFINEFWTAKQRQAHSLHEISYRACFKGQLPEFFIERLTQPGDRVYDPFMGRGTTPLQAALMGRSAVGNDINPLSTLLVRPRINPPSLAEVAARLQDIPTETAAPAQRDLLAFYHPDTLREITALREYLLAREKAGTLDRVDDWIRMVAINRLTGHSSGFFSVYSLPPNQAVSVSAQIAINEKRQQVPPRRLVKDIILKKSKSLLKDGSPPESIDALFVDGPADRSPAIADASVDLVVTSPPFLDVVQYASDNWLRCWFAGIDTTDVQISMHRKPKDWTAFVHDVFVELGRIVRPGGHVAFEVGEVRNGKIELEKCVIEALGGTPFAVEGVLINQQDFTKTANVWGVSNNSKGTNTNRIVLAQRV
jgi:hypothetical protein